MGDFWRTTSKVLHTVGVGLHVAAHIIGRPHFHRPHFHRPHFYRPHLDPHIGLRNWFYAQRRIPRRPPPLPPRYQAMHDRMVGRIMARAHDPRIMHHAPRMATPPLHRHTR
jgi:hypothetical protein